MQRTTLRTLHLVLNRGTGILLFAFLILGLNQSAMAANKACTKTSRDALIACKHEKKDDYWIARGNCQNLADKQARKKCLKKARADWADAKEECRDQYEARLEVCDAIGQGPYDPVINPDDFVDPADIGGEVVPNPYFPLVRGYKWIYHTNEGDKVTEITTDEVLSETKAIMGVECVVVHDVVYDGEPTDADIKEDTYDYYAQDQDGNVWYFGEFSLDYSEELPDMEGSWLFGVEGGKPGIIMPADPQEGDAYRQEFSLGDAEDMAEILGVGVSPEDDQLREYPCQDQCVHTKDYTPLEPDVEEFKYYKSGVGVVREENPEGGEIVELFEFTTDP